MPGTTFASLAQLVATPFFGLLGNPIYIGVYVLFIFAYALALHRASAPMWMAIMLPTFMLFAGFAVSSAIGELIPVPLLGGDGFKLLVAFAFAFFVPLFIFKYFKS